MEKTFFAWENFSKEFGNIGFPFEAIEELFLMDFETKKIRLSQKLARLL